MRYLRPGQLFHDFLLERAAGSVSGGGRPRTDYDAAHPVRLKAALASASPERVERYSRPEHPVTHTITHPGALLAAVNDRLVRGACRYYVRGVEDPGGLGLWAIYYVEERRGVDGAE